MTSDQIVAVIALSASGLALVGLAVFGAVRNWRSSNRQKWHPRSLAMVAVSSELTAFQSAIQVAGGLNRPISDLSAALGLIVAVWAGVRYVRLRRVIRRPKPLKRWQLVTLLVIYLVFAVLAIRAAVFLDTDDQWQWATCLMVLVLLGLQLGALLGRQWQRDDHRSTRGCAQKDGRVVKAPTANGHK